jgi:hypothetical protein
MLGGKLGPLPESVVSIGRLAVDSSYKHPLPRGLKYITGGLDLNRYQFPLPDQLRSIGGGVHAQYYNQAYPSSLERIGGEAYFGGNGLPPKLKTIGGNLTLGAESGPLPASLQRIGGCLTLSDYLHALPASLTSVGELRVWDYSQALPESLKRVRGDFRFANSCFPFPNTLHVGGRVRSVSCRNDFPYTSQHTAAQVAVAYLHRMYDKHDDYDYGFRHETVLLRPDNPNNPMMWTYVLYPSLFEKLVEDVVVSMSRMAGCVRDALAKCANLRVGDGVLPFNSDEERLRCVATHLGSNVSEVALIAHLENKPKPEDMIEFIISTVRQSMTASRRKAARAASKQSSTRRKQ